MVFLTQTHIKRAGTSHTHPVAAFAEIMGHWRDKAQAPTGFGYGDITRRAGGDMVTGDQGVFLFQTIPNHCQRQVLFGAITVDITQRHGFDQAKIKAFGATPSDQSRNFVFVEITERYGIDLDFQASLFGGL